MRAPRSAFALLASFVLLGLASPAAAKAPSVYINGVKVDGLANQSFTNVDVQFDENGDVRITAKGYKISAEPAEPTKAPPTAEKPAGPPVLSADHRFFIATMQPPGRTGTAQWEIDVYVNQTYVRKFRSKDPEPIFDITKFLKPGANVVHFTAKKEEGERLSTSPNDYFELIIGDGEMRAGKVMLNKITAYRRTAAETGTFNSETTLNLSNTQ